jgi:hypothetical protein
MTTGAALCDSCRAAVPTPTSLRLDSSGTDSAFARSRTLFGSRRSSYPGRRPLSERGTPKRFLLRRPRPLAFAFAMHSSGEHSLGSASGDPESRGARSVDRQSCSVCGSRWRTRNSAFRLGLRCRTLQLPWWSAQSANGCCSGGSSSPRTRSRQPVLPELEAGGPERTLSSRWHNARVAPRRAGTTSTHSQTIQTK